MTRVVKKTLTVFAVTVVTLLMTVMLALCADAAETWQLESATNMRKSYSTSASFIGTIPSGTKIKVTAKKTDSSYVWGKITRNGTTGWCVLNFSEYKSGNLGKPEITTSSTSFKETATLKWKSVPSAKKYTLKVYKSSGSLYKSYTVSSTSKSFSAPAGKYTAKVTAKNSITPSWSATGSSFAFTVTSPLVSSIKITGKSSMLKGSSATFTAAVSPSSAENKSVTWSSSDKSVITVSSSGKVKAVSFGKASVICKAKDASSVTAKYTVSVVPAAVSTPTQSAQDSSSATCKWSAISGVTGYQVYKYNSTSKKFALYSTVSGTSCKITGLSTASEVKVKVRAYAAKGSTKVYGAYSPAITLTALPAAPTGLTSSGATNSSVSLKWNSVSKAAKYVVYRYDTSSKSYVKAATVTSPSCTVKAASGEEVKVKVKAVKVFNSKNYYSAYSSVAVLYACPAAPTVKVTTGKSPYLSWSAVNGATVYAVEMSKSATAGFSTFSFANSAVRSCPLNNLASGTYYFRVRACITKGTTSCFGPWSSAVKVTV